MAPRDGQAALLRKYGLRLSKRLGQHFLVDAGVLARIVNAVGALGAQRVVELGAGAGALTGALLEAGFAVEALELDPRMVALLEAEFAGGRCRVERVDIAGDDLAARVGEEPCVFAGNLPYQVTSPVLFGLLPALARPAARGAVLMMQAEVARRLTASPGGRDQGVLSVLIQARCRVERICTVRPGAFLPPPRVDSVVVALHPREDAVILAPSAVSLVKELFGERRKQIGGLLRRRHGLAPEEVEALGRELAIDPRLRAEDLDLSGFVALDAWLARRRERE